MRPEMLCRPVCRRSFGGVSPQGHFLLLLFDFDEESVVVLLVTV
jgi:hypothetical protein